MARNLSVCEAFTYKVEFRVPSDMGAQSITFSCVSPGVLGVTPRIPAHASPAVCLVRYITLMAILLGGYCGGVPPLPIPNREVKPTCADGTAMQCGRVGGRLLS